MIYISYDWPQECLSIWGWLFYTWDFTNSRRQHEWGVRLFGLVISNWQEYQYDD